MSSQVLGLALGLSWFIIAIAVLELIAIGLRRLVSPDARPDGLFVLGIAPAIGALIFVVALFIPAQWELEGPQAPESINLTVVTLALTAVAAVVTTVFRARRALLSTRRLVSGWMLRAKRLPTQGLPLPAFVIDDPFPLAILVGVTSPSILIARCLLEQLTVRELDAVLAHELAHHVGRDNFKRLALACFPTVWCRPTAGHWSHRWAEASERAADATAAAGDPNVATALASALVKTSRLITQSSAAESLCSALRHGAPVAERVRRLLALEAVPERDVSVTLRFGLVSAVLACLVVYPSALPIVHRATEWLLHGLP
jgi:hypothetical protein